MNMEQDNNGLKKQVRLLLGYSIISSLVLLYLVVKSLVPQGSTDLIRARAIIITDSAGRDRILIGAPIPFSADRVRTDTLAVREKWAKDIGGEEYMKWYKDYHHSMNGILLLNEEGFDKLAVGDQLPDPNTGQRITIPTGLTWNDEEGFERGGLGLGQLKEGGEYRNILGFDDKMGEGLHFAILEDGSKMIRMVQGDQMLYFLANPPNSMMGNDSTFMGWKVMKMDGQVVSETNLLQRGR